MDYSIIDYIVNNDVEIRKEVEAKLSYKAVLKRKDKIYEQLRDMLNEEQRELFDKFEETQAEELCEAIKSYFKAGMKIGIRVVAEGMFD